MSKEGLRWRIQEGNRSGIRVKEGTSPGDTHYFWASARNGEESLVTRLLDSLKRGWKVDSAFDE